MEYQIGQAVYSKSGHDKGTLLLVVSVAGEYVLLADGKRRKLAKPKRKKIIHIQPTKYVDEDIAEKLTQNAYVLDADIVKALKKYQEKSVEK